MHKWLGELLRIAYLENNPPTIRNYKKYFAFVGGVYEEYYIKWKQTFSAAEWELTIESYIAETIRNVTENWNINKNKLRQKSEHPPLLQSLGKIYIMENLLDRLLILVQQDNTLYPTLQYQPYLINNYSESLLSINLPALEKRGVKVNTRTEYVEVVRIMRKIINDIPESKPPILALTKMFKEKYATKPRRPAMIEELYELFK